jgi:PadR family transcriptional regulator PadR
MAAKRTNPDFLNGVPELLVLRLLAHRAMHGYDIVQSLRLATDDSLAFGEGCIYPLLHRLEAEGLLKARREQVGGRERLVYHLTAAGKKRLAETTSAWRRITQAVEAVLGGGSHAQLA